MPTNTLTHTSTFSDDTAFVSIHINPESASKQLQDHITDQGWKFKISIEKDIFFRQKGIF